MRYVPVTYVLPRCKAALEKKIKQKVQNGEVSSNLVRLDDVTMPDVYSSEFVGTWIEYYFRVKKKDTSRNWQIVPQDGIVLAVSKASITRGKVTETACNAMVSWMQEDEEDSAVWLLEDKWMELQKQDGWCVLGRGTDCDMNGPGAELSNEDKVEQKRVASEFFLAPKPY